MRVLLTATGFGVLGLSTGLVMLVLSLTVHPIAALALVAAIPALFYFVQYPVWGLALTVAAIPLEGLGRFTSSEAAVIVSVAKLFGLATALALLINVVLGRMRLVLPREAVFLLLFCAIGVLTMFHTSDLQNGLPRVLSFITTTIFFIVIVNVVTDKRDVMTIISGLLIATAILGVFAIAQRILPGFAILNTDDTATDAIGVQVDLSEQTTLGGEVHRSGGTSGSPHVYAGNLLVAIPLYLFMVRATDDWKLRLLAIAGLLLAVANLLLTHTRAGVITCLPIVVLMIWRRLIKINLRLIGLTLIGSIAMLYMLPESVTVRLLDIERYSVDGAATLKTRFDYWTAGAEMLRDNWLFGMGMGNFSDLAHHEPSVTLGHAFMHNIYLQLFNEVGLFGFAAIMLFLASVLVRLERSYWTYIKLGETRAAYLVLALEAAFLSGVILGFTMDYLHFAVKDWWFVAGAGTCIGLLLRHRELDSPSQ